MHYPEPPRPMPYMREMNQMMPPRPMPPSLMMDPRMHPRYFQPGPPRWDPHPDPGPFTFRRPDYPGPSPSQPPHPQYPRHQLLYNPDEPPRRRYFEENQRKPRPQPAKPRAPVKPAPVKQQSAVIKSENVAEQKEKKSGPSVQETAVLVEQIENMLQELMTSGKGNEWANSTGSCSVSSKWVHPSWTGIPDSFHG